MAPIFASAKPRRAALICLFIFAISASAGHFRSEPASIQNQRRNNAYSLQEEAYSLQEEAMSANKRLRLDLRTSQQQHQDTQTGRRSDSDTAGGPSKGRSTGPSKDPPGKTLLEVVLVGVPLAASDDTILNEVRRRYKVQSARRILRYPDQHPTTFIKVRLDSSAGYERILHHGVYIADLHHKVEKPRQKKRSSPIHRCLNCQSIGTHLSHNCQNPTKCPRCAAPHREANCTAEETCCANCQGPHPGFSNQCPVWKEKTTAATLKSTPATKEDTEKRTTAIKDLGDYQEDHFRGVKKAYDDLLGEVKEVYTELLADVQELRKELRQQRPVPEQEAAQPTEEEPSAEEKQKKKQEKNRRKKEREQQEESEKAATQERRVQGEELRSIIEDRAEISRQICDSIINEVLLHPTAFELDQGEDNTIFAVRGLLGFRARHAIEEEKGNSEPEYDHVSPWPDWFQPEDAYPPTP